MPVAKRLVALKRNGWGTKAEEKPDFSPFMKHGAEAKSVGGFRFGGDEDYLR